MPPSPQPPTPPDYLAVTHTGIEKPISNTFFVTAKEPLGKTSILRVPAGKPMIINRQLNSTLGITTGVELKMQIRETQTPANLYCSVRNLHRDSNEQLQIVEATLDDLDRYQVFEENLHASLLEPIVHEVQEVLADPLKREIVEIAAEFKQSDKELAQAVVMEYEARERLDVRTQKLIER
ncbi:hypothetical protein HHI36_023792 [Cryptolaemus montrouzieri]|uniref:Uncharacterized protein n=1 Tax=Cryptolaemus montrouzieri TaxID=559131 RepID=A0ABD2PIG3_9CUCU